TTGQGKHGIPDARKRHPVHLVPTVPDRDDSRAIPGALRPGFMARPGAFTYQYRDALGCTLPQGIRRHDAAQDHGRIPAACRVRLRAWHARVAQGVRVVRTVLWAGARLVARVLLLQQRTADRTLSPGP